MTSKEITSPSATIVDGTLNSCDGQIPKLVEAALRARTERLRNEAIPAAGALCRRGRKGYIEHALHPVLQFGGIAELLHIFMGVAMAIEGMHKQCAMNHERVTLHTIRFQRREDIVGVLIDHDDRTEKEAKESQAILDGGHTAKPQY